MNESKILRATKVCSGWSKTEVIVIGNDVKSKLGGGGRVTAAKNSGQDWPSSLKRRVKKDVSMSWNSSLITFAKT